MKRYGKKVDERKITVRMPILYKLIAALSTFGFCALLFYFIVFYRGDPVGFWGYAINLSFIVFGLVTFVWFSTWKLVVEDDLIVYTPFLGMKREVKISDITRVKLTELGEYKVYTGKKRVFSVGDVEDGAEMLITRLKSEEHIQYEEPTLSQYFKKQA